MYYATLSNLNRSPQPSILKRKKMEPLPTTETSLINTEGTKQEQKKAVDIAVLVSKYNIALKQSRSREYSLDLQKRYEDKARSYKKELFEKYGVDPQNVPH